MHEWNGHLEIFSRPRVIEIASPNRYFTENSRWVPRTNIDLVWANYLIPLKRCEAIGNNSRTDFFNFLFYKNSAIPEGFSCDKPARLPHSVTTPGYRSSSSTSRSRPYAKGRPRVQFYVNYNGEFSMIGAYFECVMSVKCLCDVCLFGDKYW